MILETYDTRAQWLDARRRGLGGTDVAALLGATSYSSPWRVWADKRGIELPEPKGEALTLGSLFEEAVAMAWSDKSGRLVRRLDNVIVVHDEHAFARYSPDGFVHDGASGPLAGVEPVAAYEGKVSAGYAAEWGADGSDCAVGNVPEAYRIQLAWQLAVSGLSSGVLVCLYRGTAIREYWMQRDAELSERLLAFAGEWWRRHIENDEPPPLDATAHCAQTLTMQAGTPHGEREVDRELADAAERYDALRREAKTLDASIKECANEIRALMGASEVATGSGWKVSWADGKPPERIDLEQLENEHPDAYEACRYVGQAARTLRVTRKREK